jgi:hypothetical protein
VVRWDMGDVSVATSSPIGKFLIGISSDWRVTTRALLHRGVAPVFGGEGNGCGWHA